MATADNGDVYIFGRTVDSSGNSIPCYWLNGTYHALPVPADAVCGDPAYSMVFKGNDIYFQGSTRKASGIISPCYWKNGTYNALSLGSALYGGDVGDGIIVDDGGAVYVTGYVRYTSNGNTPCYWKNGVKTDLSVSSGGRGTAHAIYLSGSDVYVSGVYTNGSTDYEKPCLWVNGTCKYLNYTSLTCASGSNFCGYRTGGIFKDGSDVYVGGYAFQNYTDSRGWIMSPVYWKNEAMITLPLPAYENVSGGVWGGFKNMNGKIVPFGSYTCATGYASCYWLDGLCIDGFNPN
jgi:hypothetical protein